MEINNKKGTMPIYRKKYPIKNDFYSGNQIEVVEKLEDNRYKCKISEKDAFGSFITGEGKKIAEVTLTLKEFQDMVD